MCAGRGPDLDLDLLSHFQFPISEFQAARRIGNKKISTYKYYIFIYISNLLFLHIIHTLLKMKY